MTLFGTYFVVVLIAIGAKAYIIPTSELDFVYPAIGIVFTCSEIFTCWLVSMRNEFSL